MQASTARGATEHHPGVLRSNGPPLNLGGAGSSTWGMEKLHRLGAALVVVAIVTSCGGGPRPTVSANSSPIAAPTRAVSEPPLASASASGSAPASPTDSRDTVDGAWAQLAPLPQPRSEIAAAVLDGRLYVAGGFGAGRGAILDDLLAYEPAADTWTTLAPLPEARHHPALTALDGRLYLTGGGVEGFAARANTWAYDPVANAWTALAPMPAPRLAHAAVAVDGRLYVVGGVIPGLTLRAPTFAYDPTTGEWQADLAELPTYREHLAAVAVDGAVIAIGGRAAQNVDAVERYDSVSDGWSALEPLPTARSGLTAAIVGGRIHVVGGEGIDPPQVFREHEVLDIAAGRWLIGPALDRGRHGLASGAIDGHLYVVGGGPNPGLSGSDRLDVLSP